jgi:hypothetical protein
LGGRGLKNKKKTPKIKKKKKKKKKRCRDGIKICIRGKMRGGK